MKHWKILGAGIVAAVGGAPAQEDYSTWTYSRNITVNTKSSGANLTSPLTRFPLLVRFTHENGGDVVYYSKGRGADLRFTKANGVTRLHHQIDSWDSAAHTATVWVLMDSVKPNDSAVSIRLFWNKSGAADSGKGGGVFDTADGYAGVWHLGNTNDAAARPNAIPTRFPATPMNFAGGYTRKTGVIGWADSLTGGPGSEATAYLAINEGTPTTHFNFPAGNFTYTVWAKVAAADNFARMVSLVGDDATSGANRIFLAFQNGNVVGRVYADGASRPVNSTTPPPLGEWAHYAYTISRSGSDDIATLYLNGASIATATFTSPQQMPDAERAYVRIGRDNINPNSDQSLNAALDEARISSVARPAEHLKLCYDVEKPGSTVVVLGASAPMPPAIPPAALFSVASPASPNLGVRPVAGGVAFRLPAGTDGARSRLTISDLHGRVVWSRALQGSSAGSEIVWASRTSGVYVARLIPQGGRNERAGASARLFTLNP